jgi:glutathione S-transferase
VARRSVMTLFSTPTDPWSHRARLVLAEKGIAIELVNCDPLKLPEDLLDLNPYHSVPTLVDRDLVLYDSRVIMDYLDERFPHPRCTASSATGTASPRKSSSTAKARAGRTAARSSARRFARAPRCSRPSRFS